MQLARSNSNPGDLFHPLTRRIGDISCAGAPEYKKGLGITLLDFYYPPGAVT